MTEEEKAEAVLDGLGYDEYDLFVRKARYLAEIVEDLIARQLASGASASDVVLSYAHGAPLPFALGEAPGEA